MWKEISEKFHTIYSIHAAGAHDTPAAEGLGRSAERDSIPHCSSLLTACFSSSSPCSLSEEDRTKSPLTHACQTSINRSPLPSRKQAMTPVPRRQSPFVVLFFFFSAASLFQTKLEVLFFCVCVCKKKNTLMFGTNKHNKRQLRKPALGLRLQSTLLPLFAGHICIWVTKGRHTACCCANVSEEGECQPELMLHSAPHCLCSTLITNSKHYADTSHPLHQRLMWQSGQPAGRSASKQGNMLLNGSVAVVRGATPLLPWATDLKLSLWLKGTFWHLRNILICFHYLELGQKVDNALKCVW